MSDFEYLSEDENTVHVALNALKKADQSAAKWATLAGLPLGYFITRPLTKAIKSPIMTVAAPIFVASLWYHLHTRTERENYNMVSEKMNRKYSLTINKILEY